MRFDVYKLPNDGPGYIVDVQSDFLSQLPSRVVIPLILAQKYRIQIKGLHPVFDIDGKSFVLMTHETGSLPNKHLGKRVASLAAHRDDITRALDLLLTGF